MMPKFNRLKLLLRLNKRSSQRFSCRKMTILLMMTPLLLRNLPKRKSQLIIRLIRRAQRIGMLPERRRIVSKLDGKR